LKSEYDVHIRKFRKGLTKNRIKVLLDWKNEPEIPTSYPKMSPLDAATRQVMTTENVILPAKPLTAGDESTGTTPPAILMNLSLLYSLKLHFTLLSVLSV